MHILSPVTEFPCITDGVIHQDRLHTYKLRSVTSIPLNFDYSVTKSLPISWKKKRQLGAQFILSIFINLYMFRTTTCPPSGETTVFVTLRTCYSVWMTVWYAGAYAPAYQKHVQIDKYTKNKLCTKLALFTNYTGIARSTKHKKRTAVNTPNPTKSRVSMRSSVSYRVRTFACGMNFEWQVTHFRCHMSPTVKKDRRIAQVLTSYGTKQAGFHLL